MSDYDQYTRRYDQAPIYDTPRCKKCSRATGVGVDKTIWCKCGWSQINQWLALFGDLHKLRDAGTTGV